MKEEIYFLETRSFWAALLAGLTGLAQTQNANFLIPLATVLELFGLIPNADEFVSTLMPFFEAIGPMITAIFGIWAYLERIFGKKKVVFHRVNAYPPHGGQP
jgi:hypothetical protein